MKIGDLVKGNSNKIDDRIGVIIDIIRPLNNLYMIMWGSNQHSAHYPYELTVINFKQEEQ